MELFNKKEDFISVVIASKDLLGLGAITEVYQYLDDNFTDYEIIVIKSCPLDFNRKDLNELLNNVPSVRVIELSYEVDYEVAITVGLENSIGDNVFVFNPSQEGIDMLGPMSDMCKGDIDIVIGVASNQKKSIGYHIFRPFIGWALKEISYSIPRNATTLRCLSRNAVNAATQARNYHHQIFVKIAQCGLESQTFSYEVKDALSSRKNLYRAVKNTLKLLVFNSTKPLRWMSALGVSGSFMSFIFALYSFLVRLVNHNVADGWSSLVIIISILFMLLFTMLSFFGEYLARLLNEQSKHAPYWVINELHSSVMVDSERCNVVDKT
ncbi:MAG: glycosyl transferase family 2 [Colwellia sp.]